MHCELMHIVLGLGWKNVSFIFKNKFLKNKTLKTDFNHLKRKTFK